MHLSVFMGPLSPSPKSDLTMIDMCLQHAEIAANAGFAMVTFGEQHFNNYEPYCNPFMMGARLAPVLGETWFGITACPFVLRTPLRLVEDINILDVLTKGRCIVGLSGGRPSFTNDFENFGIDPKKRDDIYAAKLELMFKVWAHKAGDPGIEFDIEGDKGALNGRLMPMSWRATHPMLALASSTDTTIEDAARRGLPVFLGPMPLMQAARRIALHQQTMITAGIGPSIQADCTEKSGCLVHIICGETEDAAWQRAEAMNSQNIMIDRRDKRSLREMAAVDFFSPEGKADPFPRNIMAVNGGMLVGTPEQIVPMIQTYWNAGIKNLITRFTFGPPDKACMDDNFQLFCDRAIPLLQATRFSPLTPAQCREEYKTGCS